MVVHAIHRNGPCWALAVIDMSCPVPLATGSPVLGCLMRTNYETWCLVNLRTVEVSKTEGKVINGRGNVKLGHSPVISNLRRRLSSALYNTTLELGLGCSRTPALCSLTCSARKGDS